MRLRRNWLILGLLAFVLGTGCALLWWASQRLTPLEKRLVGRWNWTEPAKPPSQVFFLIECNPDRTLQACYFDELSGQPKGPYKMVGRWRAEGDTFVWAWDRRFIRHLIERLPLGRDLAEQWLLGQNLAGGVQRFHIVSHTDDEIQLDATGKTIVLKRYTGELRLPAKTLSLDQ